MVDTRWRHRQKAWLFVKRISYIVRSIWLSKMKESKNKSCHGSSKIWRSDTTLLLLCSFSFQRVRPAPVEHPHTLSVFISTEPKYLSRMRVRASWCGVHQGCFPGPVKVTSLQLQRGLKKVLWGLESAGNERRHRPDRRGNQIRVEAEDN